MAWTLKAHMIAVNSGNVTTGAIDTTGADLIVCVGVSFNVPTFTDNKSNGNATKRTQYQVAGDNSVTIAYWSGPTVGTGHTFTLASGGFNVLAVMAWSGSLASTPYDTENGATASSASSPMSIGSITPAAANELLIAGIGLGAAFASLAIDNSFTISDQHTYNGGANYGGAAAYLVDSASSPINPAWSWVNSVPHVAVDIASFKAAAGGGGGTDVSYDYMSCFVLP